MKDFLIALLKIVVLVVILYLIATELVLPTIEQMLFSAQKACQSVGYDYGREVDNNLILCSGKQGTEFYTIEELMALKNFLTTYKGE